MQSRNRISAKDTASTTNAIELSEITLRYRNVMEILVDMGFRGNTSQKTFNDYIKSLRRLGIPVWSEMAPRHGHLILYSFENVMDIVLALSLRVYNGVPDTVLRNLVEIQPKLHSLYRRAYAERTTGLGAPVRINQGRKLLTLTGIFLDLKINHAGGKLVEFGPPEALSPFEALKRFADSGIGCNAFAPFRLSALSEEVAVRARSAMLSDPWRSDGGSQERDMSESVADAEVTS